MQVAPDRMLHVVERGRSALADAVDVIAVAAAAREARDQRRFEEQTLCIDDLVIAAAADQRG